MTEPKAHFTLFSLIALLVLLSMPATVTGQSGNRNQLPPQPGSPKPGDELRPPSLRERQFRMLEMERELAKPLTPEEEQLALSQIAEDYKQIQIVNNKMMAAVMPGAMPKYGDVSETLGEIRNRATRLKQNLRLGKMETEKNGKAEYKPARTVQDMKSALLALDGSIMSFVNNSIFKNPEVVDVKEAAKAKRDLEIIIERSQLIKKDADHLNKYASKPE